MLHKEDSDKKGQPTLIKPADFQPINPVENKSLKVRLKIVPLLLLAVFILLVAVISYVFTARSVYLEISPVPDSLSIDGGLSFKLGERYLLQQGQFHLRIQKQGYEDLDRTIEVSADQNQTFRYELQKLPGILQVQSEPAGATVMIDGREAGVTPLQGIKVQPGTHQIEIKADRYLPETAELNVEGLHKTVIFEATLTPAWAAVSLASNPPKALIIIDDQAYGETPATIELLQGEHNVSLKLPGYQDWQKKLIIIANQHQSFTDIKLLERGGLIRLDTRPQGANITVDDRFAGRSPLELNLEPGLAHRVNIFKAGYGQASRTLTVEPGREQDLLIPLKPILANITIRVTPDKARVYVDGDYKGLSGQTFILPAQRQILVVKKQGYLDYRGVITPRVDFDQQVFVALKSKEQARRESIKSLIVAPGGQQLKLFRPGPFQMGSSRREAGRRANEVLKQVAMERAFYFGVHEVTNEQFQRFDPGHDSGELKSYSLNGNNQPVVNITWQQAALYCNWLSEQASLPLAYKIEQGKVTGLEPGSTGYRLPTEAEWAWVARSTPTSTLKYSWGNALPPPKQAGNFADLSAAVIIGRVVKQYNDTFVVSAPVGSFQASTKGVFDIDGNVAEWVNDFYGTQFNLSGKVEVDPVGPVSGKYHVIRGASWANGDISELRLSFRGYGEAGRNDVGFRIARYLE